MMPIDNDDNGVDDGKTMMILTLQRTKYLSRQVVGANTYEDEDSDDNNGGQI